LKIPPPSRRQNVTNLVTNPDPNKFEVNGGMLICRETLLPAYQNEAEHKQRQEKYFPGFTVTQKWRCVHCGKWHFTGVFICGSNGETLAQWARQFHLKPNTLRMRLARGDSFAEAIQ